MTININGIEKIEIVNKFGWWESLLYQIYLLLIQHFAIFLLGLLSRRQKTGTLHSLHSNLEENKRGGGETTTKKI